MKKTFLIFSSLLIISVPLFVSAAAGTLTGSLETTGVASTLVAEGTLKVVSATVALVMLICQTAPLPSGVLARTVARPSPVPD